MFDLTKNLPVPEEAKRLYWMLRFVLFVCMAFLAFFVIIRFIFPHAEGYFDFRIYLGAQNTIANPRDAVSGESIAQGLVRGNTHMLFNMAAVGSFSSVRVTITPRDGSLGDGDTISVVRAYRAFLYPEGDPVTFRNGMLLFDGTTYYLKSEGALRAFSSPSLVEQLGLRQDNFLHVEAAALNAEHRAAAITALSELPNDLIVKTDGNYYQIQKNELVPFVSERAFLSQFPSQNVLEKNEEILTRHAVTHNRVVGFVDGTLLSYGESVYAAEGQNLRPIDSADTFLTKGYVWTSVIPATGEEFGMYQRGKLYTIKEPHPGGTVFFYRANNQHFVIADGMKHLIPSPDLLTQYHTITPILVTALHEPEQCILTQTGFFGSYGCEIPLQKFRDESSQEYQFTFSPHKDIALQSMHTTFLRHINQENYENFVNELATKVRTRYGSTN